MFQPSKGLAYSCMPCVQKNESGQATSMWLSSSGCTGSSNGTWPGMHSRRKSRSIRSKALPQESDSATLYSFHLVSMPLRVSDEAPHCSMLDLPHSIPQHTTCNISTSNLPICECTSQCEFQAPIGQVVPQTHPKHTIQSQCVGVKACLVNAKIWPNHNISPT